MIQNVWLRKASMFLCAVGVLATLLIADRAPANTFVRMDYNLYLNAHFQNTVFIELFDDKPVTRNNFLQYVDAGLYDESIMHRLSRNFVLQGGGFYQDFVEEPALDGISLNPNAKVDLDGNPGTDNPTIVNEYSTPTVRSNLTGTLAMARVGGQVNSATNQFFFNLTNNSFLDGVDGGFTVFARVAGNGMALLNAYNSSLGIINLNPDVDENGIREGGPFGLSTTDGVPYTGNTLLRLDAANRTDYFSSTSATTIPAGNLTLTNGLGYIEAGATFTGTGSLVVSAGKTLSAGHGAAIGRPIENSGVFSPGLAVGAVSVNTYAQLPSGTLDIQIGGRSVGTLYDQVNVTAGATLAGSLKVTVLSSFSPRAGDSFTLINAGVVVGNFTTATLPTIRSGLAWDLQQTANSLRLVVLPDYNNNGTVDGGDLTLWRNSFGSTTSLAADGDGNGKVDGRDFLLWQRYFGEAVTRPPAPSIMAVPEPSTFCLVAFGILGFAARRRP